MQIIEKTRSKSLLIEYFRRFFIDMSIFGHHGGPPLERRRQSGVEPVCPLVLTKEALRRACGGRRELQVRRMLGFQDVQEFARVVLETREDGAQVSGSEMFGNDFTEDAPKIGGHREIAILIQLF